MALSWNQGGQKYRKCTRMSTSTFLWCYCSNPLKWNMGMVKLSDCETDFAVLVWLSVGKFSYNYKKVQFMFASVTFGNKLSSCQKLIIGNVMYKRRGEQMAQWWTLASATNVARVQFSAKCGFLALFRGFFFSGFSVFLSQNSTSPNSTLARIED